MEVYGWNCFTVASICKGRMNVKDHYVHVASLFVNLLYLKIIWKSEKLLYHLELYVSWLIVIYSAKKARYWYKKNVITCDV